MKSFTNIATLRNARCRRTRVCDSLKCPRTDIPPKYMYDKLINRRTGYKTKEQKCT